MNGLYPIIRRVRRPLIPVERAADAKPVNVPVTVVVVEPTSVSSLLPRTASAPHCQRYTGTDE